MCASWQSVCRSYTDDNDGKVRERESPDNYYYKEPILYCRFDGLGNDHVGFVPEKYKNVPAAMIDRENMYVRFNNIKNVGGVRNRYPAVEVRTSLSKPRRGDE
jgi:hypothetical protein